MDVSEMLTDLEDQGFDATSARMVEIINQVQWDIASRQAWPQLEKSIDLNFDGSKMAPTNWPARFRAALKVFVKSNGLRLPPWRLDDFYETYADQLTQMGTPQLYFMEQEQLQFYPIPSAANGVVTLKYIEYPAELTSSSLEADIWLPLRFHRGVLVNGAAAKLAAMEDDLELATYFENQMEKAYMQMEADLWRWQYDQPDYIHVVDDDNWSLA